MLLREPGRGQNTGVSVVASYLAGKIVGERAGVNGRHIVAVDDTWIHLLIVVFFVGIATKRLSSCHIVI